MDEEQEYGETIARRSSRCPLLRIQCIQMDSFKKEKSKQK